MSAITEFYQNDGRDTEGRTLNEILSWSDEKIESGHDFIQWLFPTTELSNFNPDAPILTENDIECFKNDSLMRTRMQISFVRFAAFLGLQVNNLMPNQPDSPSIIPVVLSPALWHEPNHNWLRITRVITSLRLVGLEDTAQLFFNCLEKLVLEGYGSQNSFAFWRGAMEQT